MRKTSAFTLVELLVTVAVISVLAALTLPSLKTLLHGQKVTQASRMVQSHVEAARIRAMSTNNYVAVILDRESSDPTDASRVDSVVRLSVGNVFPPYEGDVAGATGLLSDTIARVDASNAIANPPVAGRFRTGFRDGFCDTITINRASVSLLDADVFQPNDFIRIGDQATVFQIETIVKNASNIAVTFRNPPFLIRDFGTASETHWPTQEPLLPDLTRDLNSDGDFNDPGEQTAVSFRIFREPTKSFAQPTMLPRGTCIDLSVSGMGPSGTELAAPVYSTAPSSPPAQLPIMIVFDGRGNVAFWSNGGAVASGVPGGIIHLLVGRTEQVRPGGSIISSNANIFKVDTDPQGVNSNLNDKGNAWISINPYSGLVYSSQLFAGDEGSGNRLRTARTFATNAISATED